VSPSNQSSTQHSNFQQVITTTDTEKERDREQREGEKKRQRIREQEKQRDRKTETILKKREIENLKKHENVFILLIGSN